MANGPNIFEMLHVLKAPLNPNQPTNRKNCWGKSFQCDVDFFLVCSYSSFLYSEKGWSLNYFVVLT